MLIQLYSNNKHISPVSTGVHNLMMLVQRSLTSIQVKVLTAIRHYAISKNERVNIFLLTNLIELRWSVAFERYYEDVVSLVLNRTH